MDKLRVAVIGAGKMGLLHSGIFNSLQDCKLAAVTETNSFISRILEQNLSQVKIYKDYHSMLEDGGMDIVVITTPVFLHKVMIESALASGVNVFAEKPLALNGPECRSILETLRSSKTMVGYCRRFMGTYKLVKDLIGSDVLGSPLHFTSHLFVGQRSEKSQGWQYDVTKSGGGVLMDLGCHAIDMFHFLFGKIQTVRATGNYFFNHDIEDYAYVDFEFETNLKGSLEVSWSRREYRIPELRIDIDFDRGSITATEKYVDVFSKVSEGSIVKGHNLFYKQQLADKVPINVGGQEYTSEDLHFVRCILDKKEPSCNFHEAAKTNVIIDSIYQSIKEGQTKGITYLPE